MSTSSAQSVAKWRRIARVVPLPEVADVWDITVPDGHWFSLANGAVVHNSNGSDAARYMAITVRGTELMTRPPEQEPVITPDDARAIAWLARNPNDPDAKSVAAYLERKGLGHRLQIPTQPTLDELFAEQRKSTDRIG